MYIIYIYIYIVYTYIYIYIYTCIYIIYTYIYIWIYMDIHGYLFIEIQSDCFKTDPLRGQNQLLSTLIHSYPTLIHSYPLLSHSYPLLSHSYPLLSNSYPTLIQLLSNSYSLLFTLNFKSNVLHSYSLLSTLIHSYPLLSALNKYGRFRINGVYLDLKWCINGKDCGSKWISARKIGVLGLTSSWHWGRQCVLGVLTC